MTLLTPIRKLFTRLHDLFYPKCEYFKVCPNACEGNPTCDNEGGPFCGTWRWYQGIGRDE